MNTSMFLIVEFPTSSLPSASASDIYEQAINLHALTEIFVHLLFVTKRDEHFHQYQGNESLHWCQLKQ